MDAEFLESGSVKALLQPRPREGAFLALLHIFLLIFKLCVLNLPMKSFRQERLVSMCMVGTLTSFLKAFSFKIFQI